MAKKIILFLSEVHPNSKEEKYACPTGEIILGTQTNDAPVKYILMKEPEIDEIKCIISKKAKESGILEHFTDEVHKVRENIKITVINYSEEEDFLSGPLSKVLTTISPGDEVYIDTTGGFRTSSVLLILIVQALKYKNVTLGGAVYSNYPAKRVEEVSKDYVLFDLINGLNEFATYGDCRTLINYAQTDKAMMDIVESLNRLTEDIKLCRTDVLEDRLKTLRSKLENAKKNGSPLVKAFVPLFESKFGKELTIPSLIKWCSTNGLIEQALTIYTDRLPEYIFKNNIIAFNTNREAPKEDIPGQDKYYVLLNNGFL